MKWEYLVVRHLVRANKSTIDLMNDYGAGGWELVQVLSDGLNHVDLFFKRGKK